MLIHVFFVAKNRDIKRRSNGFLIWQDPEEFCTRWSSFRNRNWMLNNYFTEESRDQYFGGIFYWWFYLSLFLLFLLISNLPLSICQKWWQSLQKKYGLMPKIWARKTVPAGTSGRLCILLTSSKLFRTPSSSILFFFSYLYTDVCFSTISDFYVQEPWIS